MVSVSDITKLLDMIPLWKQLKTLPDRVAALEQRLAAMDGNATTHPNKPCPSCGAVAFRLAESKPDEIFGVVGDSRDIYRCSACGYEKQTLSQ